MANLDGLEEALISYIQSEVNPRADIDLHTDLLGGEVLDSIGILAVIGFVEDRYGLEIEAEDVSLESFRNVRAIRQLVADKLSE